MKGLCLWATCQTLCPRDTSPHPAPLLMIFQKLLPGVPHLKGSSASEAVVPCGLGSCSRAAGRGMNHSVYMFGAVVCLCCDNCNKSMETWLTQHNVKIIRFCIRSEYKLQLTHCRESEQGILQGHVVIGLSDQVSRGNSLL